MCIIFYFQTSLGYASKTLNGHRDSGVIKLTTPTCIIMEELNIITIWCVLCDFSEISFYK